MADIEVYLRGPIDGRFTRSLVADLRKIGSVDIIYPEEWADQSAFVTAGGDELPVRLTSAAALAAEERVHQAIRKWTREPQRADETRERVAVVTGPSGEVLTGRSGRAANG